MPPPPQRRGLVVADGEAVSAKDAVFGAQAMLHVRATYLNDQWNEFIENRIV